MNLAHNQPRTSMLFSSQESATTRASGLFSGTSIDKYEGWTFNVNFGTCFTTCSKKGVSFWTHSQNRYELNSRNLLTDFYRRILLGLCLFISLFLVCVLLKLYFSLANNRNFRLITIGVDFRCMKQRNDFLNTICYLSFMVTIVF